MKRSSNEYPGFFLLPIWKEVHIMMNVWIQMSSYVKTDNWKTNRPYLLRGWEKSQLNLQENLHLPWWCNSKSKVHSMPNKLLVTLFVFAFALKIIIKRSRKKTKCLQPMSHSSFWCLSLERWLSKQASYGGKTTSNKERAAKSKFPWVEFRISLSYEFFSDL